MIKNTMLLKNICKLQIGAILNRYVRNNGSPYRVLKMNNINRAETYFKHSEAEIIYLEDSRVRALPESDIAVFLHGQMFAISVEDCNNVVVPSSFAVLSNIDVNVVDKWFLIYAINKFISSQEFFERYSIVGTSIRVLQINALKNLEICLPNLDVQQLIGSYYKKICVKRRYNRELVEHECDLEENNLAEMVSGILKENI